MVRETFEPSKTVSMVARLRGVNPNQVFHWCKLYQDGGLSAVSPGEEVVPASELADALKQIKELQRLLGKKTMERKSCAKLSNTVEQENGLRAHHHCRGTASETGLRSSRHSALERDGEARPAC